MASPLQIRPFEPADWPAVMVAVHSSGANAGYVVAAHSRWQRNGFQIAGTLPGAFRHRQLGSVDALVMIHSLVEGRLA